VVGELGAEDDRGRRDTVLVPGGVRAQVRRRKEARVERDPEAAQALWIVGGRTVRRASSSVLRGNDLHHGTEDLGHERVFEVLLGIQHVRAGGSMGRSIDLRQQSDPCFDRPSSEVKPYAVAQASSSGCTRMTEREGMPRSSQPIHPLSARSP
jgi:hypothetical protein